MFRIKRWSECNTCKICEKTCEWGAIRGPKIVASECVRCDDCERLYMDQKKCPHWIILRRKGNMFVLLAHALANERRDSQRQNGTRRLNASRNRESRVFRVSC